MVAHNRTMLLGISPCRQLLDLSHAIEEIEDMPGQQCRRST
jgi:hypothetical protein